MGPERSVRCGLAGYYLYDDQIVGGNVGVRADYNRRQRVGRLHVKNIRTAALGERRGSDDDDFSLTVGHSASAVSNQSECLQ